MKVSNSLITADARSSEAGSINPAQGAAGDGERPNLFKEDILEPGSEIQSSSTTTPSKKVKEKKALAQQFREELYSQ